MLSGGTISFFIAHQFSFKKNKKVKGLFVAGKSKAQWFKVTNKQKLTKIYVHSSELNYALNFKVYYKSKGKWYSTRTIVTKQSDYNDDVFTCRINKKAKHTYYIKVYPECTTSGYYTIKWK